MDEEYIIGVFSKKKLGKSTFIKTIFKDCETNSSYDNYTIWLNLYTIKDINNFALIESPGDTEIDNSLDFFCVLKGYLYSKMFVYLLSEESPLDRDSMKYNEKLNTLIKFNKINKWI